MMPYLYVLLVYVALRYSIVSEALRYSTVSEALRYSTYDAVALRAPSAAAGHIAEH